MFHYSLTISIVGGYRKGFLSHTLLSSCIYKHEILTYIILTSFCLFIMLQATEDSPIKRSSVAVLTVYVSPPYTPAINNPYRANRTVITVLQILSVIVILSFTAGFVYIARHRNMKHKVANLKENAEKNDTIDDIEEFMVATSTNEVMTCAQPVLALPEPGPVLLSVPSPDPIPTTSQSPISTRKVTFDLPEKTYKMIYGTKGRRNRKP